MPPVDYRTLAVVMALEEIDPDHARPRGLVRKVQQRYPIASQSTIASAVRLREQVRGDLLAAAV